MKNLLKHLTKIFSFIAITTFISCSGGGNGGGGGVVNPTPVPTEIIPTNLKLDITIVGADANNPNGDGSGKIQCVASATNADYFGFRFGSGSEITSSTGIIDYTYTTKGNNLYTVYVFAYSKTGNSISTSKEITVYVKDQYSLVWSDEFNTDGAPDAAKWNYDIGNGNNGWGNSELEYYTNRSSNVVVSNGVLKITAKKETYNGFEYTSARLKTQGKFDFKYGKVVVSAKLPEGVGTWPAIWMLGSNIVSVGWPASGEIDIMEHVGKDPGNIHGSIHTPSSYGATVNTGQKYIADYATAFHEYSVEWDADKIMFLIDGIDFYTYKPGIKNSSTWPFDANQFIILNVAMGGNFGGSVDSNFSQSTMEIDYVRVYQY